MPHKIADFTSLLPKIVLENADEIGDLSLFVRQTISQRYSQDKALELVSDVAGNGTSYLDLPSVPDGQFGVFEPTFSLISKIEYPIGQRPAQYLDDSDFDLYQTPDGYKVALDLDAPPSSDALRITWTSRHAPDGSTVPEGDFHAIVDYAASLALEALGAYYLSSSQASISADVVNYQSRSSQALSLAKSFRRRYFNHVGVDESATSSGAGDVKAAFAVGQMSSETITGVDRMVHGKFTR